MPYQEVRIADLRVNRANDRHGELVDESAAISELFRLYEQRMRNLASDIEEQRAIYDPPLVRPDDGLFVVFDGNRRVTCLKLILEPQRAPTQDLQRFFRTLHDEWGANLPQEITCQVEDDRDVIDAILHRRHTGSQKGVGQIDWNDRAKLTFAERTGQGGSVNVAAEVEGFLRSEEQLPEQPIPWSTLTRLLSSEEFRNRVGISTAGRRFQLTHNAEAVADALERITGDLARQDVTLGDLWNNEGKRAYLNRLEEEAALPTEQERLAEPAAPEGVPRRARRRRPRPAPRQTTFIPRDAQHIPWIGTQQRVRAVWEELQTLELRTHPNAIAALLRILVELAVESYVAEHHLQVAEGLSRRVGAVAVSLRDRQIIDAAYFDEINRIRRDDALISIPSMHRYIHSPDFAPMEGAVEFRASPTYSQLTGPSASRSEKTPRQLSGADIPGQPEAAAKSSRFRGVEVVGHLDSPVRPPNFHFLKEVIMSTTKSATRFKRARNDSTLGSLTEAIARTFGLPAECVRIVKPDGRKMRSDAKVGVLRNAWDY